MADHNDAGLLAPTERDLRLESDAGHRTVDGLSRSHPLRHRQLADASQLRLQRCRGVLCIHFRIYRRLRLRSGDGPWTVSRRHQAPAETSMAALRRAYFPVPVFRRADLARGAPLRQSDVRE